MPGWPFVLSPKALGQMEAAMKQGLKMEKDIASGDTSGASFDSQNLLEELAKMVLTISYAWCKILNTRSLLLGEKKLS